MLTIAIRNLQEEECLRKLQGISPNQTHSLADLITDGPFSGRLADLGQGPSVFLDLLPVSILSSVPVGAVKAKLCKVTCTTWRRSSFT